LLSSKDVAVYDVTLLFVSSLVDSLELFFFSFNVFYTFESD